MPCASVTVDALYGITVGLGTLHDLMNEISVTAEAVFLKNLRIVRLDENRLVKILERKPLGMVVAVGRLGKVLPDQIMGQVTINANSNSMVRAFSPRIVLIVHNVAVDAGFRIGRKVRETFRIFESICTNPG